MSATRLRLFLAPLAEQPGRTALSIVAVALGVALGYAVQLLNRAAIDEFAAAQRMLAGEADWVVRGPRSGFDEMLYARLAKLPEVAVASPVLEADAALPGRDESLRVLGLDVFRARRVQPDLLAGDFADRLDFLRPDRIFLSPAAAGWLHLRRGDTLVLQSGLAAVPFRVAGILGAGVRPRIAVMDIAAAQALFARPGVLNRVDLRLRPGVAPERFAKALQAQLPAGVWVERPQAELDRGRELSRAYRVNLNVLALVALFTGSLLVFSTQALAVVRRRVSLALLRVIGLTRAQLVAMVLAEAATLGAIGALVGLAFGHALGEFVLDHFGAELGAGYFRGLRPQTPFDPLSLALFFALGVVAAVGGSLMPSVEAARAQPALALKAGDEQRFFERMRPVWPGLAVFALGAALTRVPPLDGLPIAGYVAIALLLIGAILLMPRITAVVLRAAPLPRAAPARIALAQLRSAPGQASVSLAAIVASVSLVVSMAIMVFSFRHSLEDWLEEILPADLYLRTGTSGDSAFLSPAEQQRIAALPGVRRAEFLRIERILIDPRRPPLALLAREVERTHRLPPIVGMRYMRVSGDPPPAWVSEVAAELYGWHPGEVITLPIAGREARFVVAGVWRDYARQQGAVLVEREDYLRAGGSPRANDAALWLEAGVTAEQAKHEILERVPGAARLEISSPGEIRRASLRIFDRTFAVTYALEAVAIVIGLAGLSSSFAALVLARQREFGVLRHLGMTRGQIAAMLATEGALVCALALGAGAVLGWLISLVLIHVVNRQSFHWSMDLHLPWATLAGFVAAMLALGVVTAVASARRAMGGDPARAVKEDW